MNSWIYVYGVYHVVVSLWGLWAVRKYMQVSQGIRLQHFDKTTLPFKRVDIDSWNPVQSCIGAVLLLPIRFVGAISVITLSCIISHILYFTVHKVGFKKNPLRVSLPIRMYRNYIRHAAKLTVFFCGVSVNFAQEYTIDEDGMVAIKPGVIKTPSKYGLYTTVVGNHVAAFDILVSMHFLQPGFIAKHTVKRDVLVGPIAKALGTTFVNRGNSESREATLQSIVNRQDKLAIQYESNVRRKDDNFPLYNLLAPLMIYPEGTTAAGATLLNFKRGAFTRAKGEVYPLISVYAARSYNRGMFIPAYDVLSMVAYLPLSMSNLGLIKCRTFWAVNPLIAKDHEEPEAFATRTRNLMLSLMCMVSPYKFEHETSVTPRSDHVEIKKALSMSFTSPNASCATRSPENVLKPSLEETTNIGDSSPAPEVETLPTDANMVPECIDGY